jgi:hypothetical protein
VLLAACGTTGSSGDASTGSVTGSSTVASTPAASSAASSTPAPSTGTQSFTGALDPASTTWFGVLCTDLLGPFHAVDKADAALGTMGAGPDNPALGVAYGAALLAAVEKTSTSLAGTPPPGFDGGQAYAAAVTSQLTNVLTAMRTGQADATAALQSLNTMDKAAVEKYLEDSGRAMLELIGPLFTAIGQLDPAVQVKANEIPSCKAAGGIELVAPPVAPAELDAASVTWFDTLCTTLMGPLGEVAASEKSATAATSSQNPSASADRALQIITRTADTMARTPPPQFAGGPAYASAVTAALQRQVEAGGTASMEELMSAIGGLDPAVWAAADQIPSCTGQLPGGF